MTITADIQEKNIASYGTPVYSLFQAIEVDTLERKNLELLAAGTLGAMRVRDFFTPEQCAEIMRSLEDCEMGSYDEQLVQPRVPKLGPATYDYYTRYADKQLPDAYWEHTEQSNKSRATLLFGGDPLDAATEKIGKAWGGPIANATSEGRAMFAGMIRESIKGVRMHFDEIVREIPGAVDEPPICQLAFNVHLAMPESGGDTTIYRRRWKPTDELPENRDSYGYAEHIAADEPALTVRAAVGDAMFFDPRNYHIVRPNTAEGRRVTLSFFVGITGSGKLIVWS
ncbi:hypothetical protein [Streptomyces noursei]|uniref:2OG-Fe(II)-dependent halogenase WelO5 family protein n=1 Tax=Streptomyces noursei TaxID=1971 RepID=UPI00081C7092|nr:hypothetical protein [Streptomyces noursei]ANZ18055.1 hypothetical protein SNOUR_23930 [Streptomyces noursei ATCC 11455]MCZ0994869.1 hypothetical protein [Streptomyces noursei]MCZ1016390.1 hypothetical protein [Streptomyces noursei]GGX00037.1 hypothetical protein GCM10010341_22130 [Streptomyces noursei]